MNEVIEATKALIGNTVGGKPSAVLLAAYLAESVNILPDDLEELIPELLIMIGVTPC